MEASHLPSSCTITSSGMLEQKAEEVQNMEQVDKVPR